MDRVVAQLLAEVDGAQVNSRLAVFHGLCLTA